MCIVYDWGVYVNFMYFIYFLTYFAEKNNWSKYYRFCLIIIIIIRLMYNNFIIICPKYITKILYNSFM